jgi:hypothetical protein
MSAIHTLLVRFLPEDASVLEIGCGSCHDAAFLLEYLFKFASQVRVLVAPDGILFLSGSVRNLPSRENRDEHGRLIVESVPQEIQLLFERVELQSLTRVQNDDALGRPVKWFSLVMRRACIATHHWIVIWNSFTMKITSNNGD